MIMMTLFATILTILFLAGGCFILIRDICNIVEALTSNVSFSRKMTEKKGTVTLRQAYATR
jgi:hypothetical protein